MKKQKKKTVLTRFLPVLMLLMAMAIFTPVKAHAEGLLSLDPSTGGTVTLVDSDGEAVPPSSDRAPQTLAEAGTIWTATAKPDTDYAFKGWRLGRSMKENQSMPLLIPDRIFTIEMRTINTFYRADFVKKEDMAGRHIVVPEGGTYPDNGTCGFIWPEGTNGEDAFKEGDRVSLSHVAIEKEDFIRKPMVGWSIKEGSLVLKDEAGNKINYEKSGDEYVFTMPNSNVFYTVAFVKDYSIKVKEGIENGTVEVTEPTDTDKVHEGDKVTLDVKPDKGFAVSKVEYTYVSDGSEVTKEAELANEVYSFTMPAADVTVSADFVTHKHPLTHYEAVPATCTEDGNIAYAICNVGEDACGKYFKEGEDPTDLVEITKEDTVIKALGHNYGEWEKLDEQQHQRVCANDKTHTIKADHVWDAGKITKAATAKQNGIKTYTCSDCGATKTETVPRTPEVSEKDSPITTPKYGVIAIKGIARGKTAIKFSWNKIKGADRYVIYMCRCNSDEEEHVPKKVKTVKAGTLSWTARSLRKNTKYKYYVVARKKVKGKEKTILKSLSGHTITGNRTKLHTNPKSLKVNKSKVTLTKGKTFRIKSKIKKIYKNKVLLNHVERLRYLSSNKKVAKVSKSGTIKAVTRGTCTVYVQAVNGMWETITVTVK